MISLYTEFTWIFLLRNKNDNLLKDMQNYQIRQMVFDAVFFGWNVTTKTVNRVCWDSLGSVVQPHVKISLASQTRRSVFQWRNTLLPVGLLPNSCHLVFISLNRAWGLIFKQSLITLKCSFSGIGLKVYYGVKVLHHCKSNY